MRFLLPFSFLCRLTEKEHVDPMAALFECFKCFAYLIFHGIDRNAHLFGYFFIFESVALAHQQHFATFFRQ